MFRAHQLRWIVQNVEHNYNNYIQSANIIQETEIKLILSAKWKQNFNLIAMHFDHSYSVLTHHLRRKLFDE